MKATRHRKPIYTVMVRVLFDDGYRTLRTIACQRELDLANRIAAAFMSDPNMDVAIIRD